MKVLLILLVATQIVTQVYSFYFNSKLRTTKNIARIYNSNNDIKDSTENHESDVTVNSIDNNNDNNSSNGPCPCAAKCSGEYLEKGCDGNGKIQGGIALYLPWWPIKVYRPCPAYLAAGYQYSREGQTMEQVLFSEPSTKMQEKMKQLQKKELFNNDKNNNNNGSDDEVDRLYKEKFGNKE